MPSINRSIRDLAQTDDFVSRHIGPRNIELSEMLSEIGLSSMDALVEKTVPAAIFDGSPIDLPESRMEADVLAELLQLARANKPMKSLIGMGYYDCIIPPVVLRNVLENPGWYTAYTPYQPEISQGRLEALLNFQTMVADLTGMEIANASLLDEGTAAAEAMTMCRRVGKLKSDKFFAAADCHPQTIAVLKTRAKPLGIELVIGDPFSDLDTADVYAALLQYPATDGSIQDYRQISASLKEAGAMLVVATDLLALTLLTPPGEWGADIAVGSAQRFGVPLGFGGPHAAFFATSDAHKRAMPGRLVGVSVDTRGRSALRLALQTREQHIRREKATSNICTAQVLLAVMAGCYAVYHGPERLRTIAERVHRSTAIFAAGLGRLHPFAPLDQAEGLVELAEGVDAMLCRITGFDAVSLQPNAGSQGEYAGLLTIRCYHESRGDTDRDICLIPSSAHCTNPASAVMEGMRVVVVGAMRMGI